MGPYLFETPTVLDLFCGCGGLSLGFNRAGYETLAGVDFNADAIATYRRNHWSPGFCLDVTAAPPETLLDAVLPERDAADVVVGGPPCQPYSRAGPNDPDDPRRNLVHKFVDIVEAADPRAFVLENVPELTSKKHEDVFNLLLERSDDLGFEVGHTILTASDYGVPQRRRRVFVIGVRDGTPKFPEPTTAENPPTVRSYLYDILVMRVPNDDESNHKPGPINDWSKATFGHDPNGSGNQIKLDPDRPANTVRKSNKHWNPETPRYLTAREEAALQSFPLGYLFLGSKTSQSEQIGNAVPPLLAEHVAYSLLDSMGIEYKENPTDAVGMSLQEISNMGGRLTKREVAALLYRSNGWKWDEVADAMGVATSTAYEYFSRAEKKYEEAQQTASMFERLSEGV